MTRYWKEIKEILRNCEKTINDASGYNDTTNKILDYITNLQQKVEKLENIRKETIKYILKNKLYRFEYDDEELFEITTDKKAKNDLLNILNKGSDKE